MQAAQELEPRTPAKSALKVLETARLASSTAESTTRELVAHARELGATWADIAAALGVTRQAARQRFGR